MSCSQTGDCNPIEGGVRISVGGEGYCSSGYRATIGTATGFVTAGHCNTGATGTVVGQPTTLPWDQIGTVTQNDFYDGTFCDCAFVNNTAETTSSNVFNGQTISGTVFPTMYDWIEMEGATTQGSMGGITSTYENIQPTLQPSGQKFWIYGTVETTAPAANGDSGGSVIESTTGTPGFMGIISASDGSTTYYIPYYRITNAFSGITLG